MKIDLVLRTLSLLCSGALFAVASKISGNFGAEAHSKAAIISTVVPTVGIISSHNSGKSWAKSTDSKELWGSIAMDSTGKFLIAASKQNGVQISNDKGLSWASTSLDMSKEWKIVTSDAWGKLVGAVESDGGIFLSSDSGKSWKESSAPAEQYVDLVVDGAGKVLVGVVHEGGVFVSSDAGESWSQSTAPLAPWTAVTANHDGMHFAATVNDGSIYTSANAGLTWLESSAPVASWVGIDSDASGKYLVAAAKHGGIYVSEDFGRTWTQSSALTQEWSSVACDASGRHIVAGVSNGVVYESSDRGLTWSVVELHNASKHVANSVQASPEFDALFKTFGGNGVVGTLAGPTWTPTMEFTEAPSHEPTEYVQPTNRPSVTPVLDNLFFQSFLRVQNVDGSEFSEAGILTLRQALAQIGNLNIDWVFFVNSILASDYHPGSRRSLAAENLVAIFNISMPLSSHPEFGTDSHALFNFVKNQIDNGVTSGEFTTELLNKAQENGAGELLGASSDQPPDYDHIITVHAPTMAPTTVPFSTEEPTREPTTEVGGFLPTAAPSEELSEEPTAEPTDEPTASPTAEPSEVPTAEPSDEPSVEPTAEPTAEVTDEPTAAPTAEASDEPTHEPTAEPTHEPTHESTDEPTFEPTQEPTVEIGDGHTQHPTMDTWREYIEFEAWLNVTSVLEDHLTNNGVDALISTYNVITNIPENHFQYAGINSVVPQVENAGAIDGRRLTNGNFSMVAGVRITLKISDYPQFYGNGTALYVYMTSLIYNAVYLPDKDLQKELREQAHTLFALELYYVDVTGVRFARFKLIESTHGPTSQPTGQPSGQPTSSPTDAEGVDCNENGMAWTGIGWEEDERCKHHHHHPSAAPTESPNNAPPSNGPPSNGPPSNGPPSNNPPSNGPPSSGPPSNNPPSNGPPSNGPPSNGPPSNNPPSNDPPSNGPPTHHHDDPSIAPTASPTPVPSLQPSIRPTDAEDLLIFKVIFTIAGVADTQFSDEAQLSLLDTMNNVGDLDAGVAEFLGVRSVDGVARRQLTESHSLVIATRLHLAVIDYAPMNSSQLYNSMVKTFTESVAKTVFTTQLRHFAHHHDASSLFNATVLGVTYEDGPATTTDCVGDNCNTQSNTKWTPEVIAAIVSCTVIGVVILLGIAYVTYKRFYKADNTEKDNLYFKNQQVTVSISEPSSGVEVDGPVSEINGDVTDETVIDIINEIHLVEDIYDKYNSTSVDEYDHRIAEMTPEHK